MNLIRRIISYIVIVIFSFALTPSISFASDNEINLQIKLKIGNSTAIVNGVTVKIDPDNDKVVPLKINGRTMVPVRFIAESLDASVSWNSGNQCVIEKGDKVIVMNVGQTKFYINGAEKFMDVPPKIIEGRIEVPARYVAEALNKNISYDEYSQTIIISNKELYSNKFYTNNSNEYMHAVFDGTSLSVKGRTMRNKYVRGMIYQVTRHFIGGTDIREIISEATTVQVDGTFSLTFDFSEIQTDCDGELFVFMGDTEDDTSSVGYDAILWKKTTQGLFFYIGDDLIIKDNLEKQNNMQKLNPHINYDINSEIKKFTSTLISGASSDMQKVKIIHDWIADNIYYDYDSYLNHKIPSGRYNATDVFKNKLAVCEGYSSLFEEMLNAAGIPCITVSGVAIYPSQTWEENRYAWPNHAWNEVYINGRWMIVDVTWDTSNQLTNGKYVKGSISYRYFDPTIEFFSLDHHMM